MLKQLKPWWDLAKWAFVSLCWVFVFVIAAFEILTGPIR